MCPLKSVNAKMLLISSIYIAFPLFSVRTWLTSLAKPLPRISGNTLKFILTELDLLFYFWDDLAQIFDISGGFSVDPC